MIDPLRVLTGATRFDSLQEETRRHRRRHGCVAYTFEDGAGLLAMARAEKAARILELGTALGYTASLLAAATPTTRVDTIELDPEHVPLARENLRKLGLAERVQVHEGDFEAMMAGLDGPYDLAFFDGLGPTLWLVNHLQALLRPGGLLVCGNFSLAAGDERRSLEAEFANADRWRAEASIKSGSTRAFRLTGEASARPGTTSSEQNRRAFDEQR